MSNVDIIPSGDNPIPEDFDSYSFRCDSCGKTKTYTQETIDSQKKPYEHPQDHDYDYYLSCPFCTMGHMEPPTLVSFGGLFAE